MKNEEMAIRDISELSKGKSAVLGLQHLFTMFGATVLVPIITGLNISVALFMAGAGTLLFHVVTKGKIPVFLGSSFAFIAPMLAVTQLTNIQYAQGGIVVAGLVYLLLAGLIYFFGAEKIISFFPPVVTGSIIMVIGLKLAPIAIKMAKDNWTLAIVSFAIVAIVSVYMKGFIKVLPVVFGLLGGYLLALLTGVVDFTPIAEAGWIGVPSFTIARFSWTTVMMIAPVAIATSVEHIGDVLAIRGITGDDYLENPGLHRTMLGDGLATALSAMFGGPANTTYSENTGVLALTKVYDPKVMQIAACFAILLAVIPKLGAILTTIPTPVVGGISIILFGMIAAIGGKIFVENKVDFMKSRNLIITAVILVLGIGGASLQITTNFSIDGMALAAIIGIILNKVLPE
ncbi:MAG: uracil permease [Alkaliphilus sp.]|nr:uracil permease [bacterium AH-315-L21]MBN4074791.1 uracil permease [bacterium AH-315-E09]PHS34790.1 MAG: uracil permease [Alkaliphilus sp.]